MFYFYWFGGRRLLDGPLEALLADPTLDFPFCLMWANENWTRRWDGSDHEVLIAQDREGPDDAALVDCLSRHFDDPRYVRVGGQPLFMVYRPQSIPAVAERVPRWRALLAERGHPAPIFTMAQSFDARDPRDVGFDGAVEFPPHKTCNELRPLNAELDILDTDFSARVYSYDDTAAASLAEPTPPYPLIKTVVPGWDNDARRQGAGLVLHGATPATYERWLRDLITRAQAERFFGDAIVCVNAWNEWAEGAALEPDVHFGSAFLNATGRAITGAARGTRVLLVGHDALAHGAQMLLLALARRLAGTHGVRLDVLLGGRGPLEGEFAAVAPTAVIAFDDAGLAGQIERYRRDGVDVALVNSCASGAVAAALAARDIRVVLLAHEMDGILREKNLTEVARAGLAAASEVVVAAPEVADALGRATGFDAGRATLLPQGLYRALDRREVANGRTAARAALGVGADEIVVLGLGYADLRKGFDLFLAMAGMENGADRPMRFVWAGGMDGDVARHFGPEMEAAAARGVFVHAGFVADPTPLLAAADCFALTSREDPFPSVALEALACGVPVVAWAGTGGIPGLVGELRAGAVVGRGDLPGFRAAIGRVAAMPAAARGRFARAVVQRFDFAAYAHRLLRTLRPAAIDVSVVVPSCNYERYMAERLESIFRQTHPVREVLVLDDASADGSVEAARATARRAGRTVVIEVADVNGGSVFRQWRRAAERARGEWLWIAEADDTSEPGFLHALASRLEGIDGAVLAFTDSRPVDENGAALDGSYKPYYRTHGCLALERDFVLPGAEVLRLCLSERNLLLNASAVLFRRAALLAAFERCGDELDGLRVAGDWRIYAEMLRAPGAWAAYVAEPLNVHRRHAGSVTHRLDAKRHAGEIATVRRAVAPGRPPVGTRRRAAPGTTAREP